MGDVMDPLEAARKKDFDPSNMAEVMLSFPEQLQQAISQPLRLEADFRQICICGMGGSAIGGDIIADHSFGQSQKPVFVVRGVQLPDWACRDTLVLVTSYSGNTRETLELFRQAVVGGCQVIGISSGGTLEQRCQENGFGHVKVPGGLQPRCALGYMLGYLANILGCMGMPQCRQEIERCIPLLKELRQEIGPQNPDSPVRQLAQRTHNHVPVFYSYTYMASSALRWKNQVNENSKKIAFSGIMPEFNHNEVVGWTEGVKGSQCLPIFLYDPDAPALLKDMMDASLEALRENGVAMEVVEIRGRSVMEKNLRSVMHADFYSLYLAFLKNVDPMPVRSIVSLKERLQGGRGRKPEDKPKGRGKKSRRS